MEYSRDKTYNFVYKTTNLVNGKTYIGVHSTDDLEDGYLGSGIAFKKALKKYGMHNFKKEILYFYATRKEAEYFEEVLVDDAFVKRTDNYNIVKGGVARGGCDVWSGAKAEEARLKVSKRSKGYRNPDFERSWQPIYDKVADTACHYFCNTNLPDRLIGSLIKSRFNHSLKVPRLLKYYVYCKYIKVVEKVEWRDFFGRGYIPSQRAVKTICRSLVKTNRYVESSVYKSLKTSYLSSFYELVGFLNNFSVSDSMLINDRVGASFGKGINSRIKYFKYLGFLEKDYKMKIDVSKVFNEPFRRLAIKTVYKTPPVNSFLAIDVDGGYDEYRVSFDGSTFQKTRV